MIEQDIAPLGIRTRIRTAMLACAGSLSLVAGVNADALLNGVNYPTIQAAIDAASPGDVIDVTPGTYTSGGQAVLRFLDKSIRVRAVGGPSQTVIDGQDARRGVLISAPASGAGNAVLEGFTIINGRAADHGGGVLMGGRAWLVDCRVIESVAPRGGGVAVLGELATSNGIQSFNGGFDDVAILGNESTSDGGGVALLGTSDPSDLVFTLRGSVLVNGNQAAGRGGGLYIDDAELGMLAGPDVNALAIEDNRSGGTGGGLHARHSVLDLDGTFAFEVLRNHAQANGGGCALVSCTGARLHMGTFANNESHGIDAYGGGLWAKDSSYELVQVDFEGNIAGGGGGGIRNRRSDVLIHSCDFFSNIAQGAGGGGFSSEESDETTIIASRFGQNRGLVQGGAIRLVHCDRVEMSESEIVGNHAFSFTDPDHTYGGGAYLQFAHLFSTGNEWSENLAGYGGGLHSMNMQSVNGSTPSVIESDRFIGNEASYASGGGIGLNGDGIYEVRSSEFTGNRSSGASALSAAGNQGVTIDILDSHFLGNGASSPTEAVGLMNAHATIRNSVFKDNSGAGVETILATSVDITDSCFCNNGYGVRNQSSNATVGIGGCKFASNVLDIDGAWVETAMNFFMTFCPCGSSPDCDITGDGIVDGVDLAALLGSWGTSNPDADLDMDGVVGGGDLAMLLGCWN